jgi:hypothetical protein
MLSLVAITSCQINHNQNLILGGTLAFHKSSNFHFIKIHTILSKEISQRTTLILLTSRKDYLFPHQEDMS